MKNFKTISLMNLIFLILPILTGCNMTKLTVNQTVKVFAEPNFRQGDRSCVGRCGYHVKPQDI